MLCDMLPPMVHVSVERAHQAAATCIAPWSDTGLEAGPLPSCDDSEACGAGGTLLELEYRTRLALLARRRWTRGLRQLDPCRIAALRLTPGHVCTSPPRLAPSNRTCTPRPEEGQNICRHCITLLAPIVTVRR